MSSSLWFLGFFGSVFALCHEYSKLSPNSEKFQSVKGKVKLSSKFSRAVSGNFLCCLQRFVHTATENKKAISWESRTVKLLKYTGRII